MTISIHAPRTGSDCRLGSSANRAGKISIHAPRTGSDRSRPDRAYHLRDFNPRSPHGERRDKGQHGLTMSDCISIHAPRTGSDKAEAGRLRAEGVFQSTLPARGATHISRLCSLSSPISIHAPRTGSDCADGMRFKPCEEISIHAPRTGSDLLHSCKRSYSILFQSTLPARGATVCSRRSGRDKAFQSTLPARGATFVGSFPLRPKRFQSTLPARGATRSAYAAIRNITISIHAPRTGSDCAK